MTVSDYNTNLTVIILVGIGILKCMFYLIEMHPTVILLESCRNCFIWMTVSDYNTNPTVIILVGIGILIPSDSNYTSWDWNEMHVLIFDIWKCYNTNPTLVTCFIYWYLIYWIRLVQTIIPIPHD